jgi:hypothetical protein
MLTSKTAHLISFVIGSFFLGLSVYQAFFVPKSYFYTAFALGTWLIFDFIDYKLNNTSILSFFYNHKHRFAFYFFFLVAFIFCFIVDYLWGVRVLKTWEWMDYTLIEYLRMYLIMNISFVLGIYEFYRVLKTLLKNKIADKNLLSFRFPHHIKDILYVTTLLVGVFFLVSPVFVEAFDVHALASFIMIFPFISISFITDSITYLTHGKSILEDLVRLNRLQLTALLLTILLAFIFTEGLNLFGREWKYLQMPFYYLQIFSIPISVLIGWIPLVIGLISMVNMIKHLNNR